MAGLVGRKGEMAARVGSEGKMARRMGREGDVAWIYQPDGLTPYPCRLKDKLIFSPYVKRILKNIFIVSLV